MTDKTLIVLAHPQYEHSKANKMLVECAKKIDTIEILDLYEEYADFFINVRREKERLSNYQNIILQFPFQWYSCPSLLKEWLDRVLEQGWAFGDDTLALKDKTFACVLTTGGTRYSYTKKGHNRYSVYEFLTPFDQTAHLCQMKYKAPFVVYKAHHLDEIETKKYEDDYMKWLDKIIA